MKVTSDDAFAIPLTSESLGSGTRNGNADNFMNDVPPYAAVNGICGHDWSATLLAHPFWCHVDHVTLEVEGQENLRSI